MFSILCYKCNKSVSARSYRVVLLVFNEPWKDFFFSRRLCNFALPSPMYISPIPHLHLVLHWFLAWWVYNDITILFFVCNTSKVQHPFLYLSTKWIYSLLKYLINKSPSLMPIWIFHFQILEPPHIHHFLIHLLKQPSRTLNSWSSCFCVLLSVITGVLHVFRESSIWFRC